MPPIAERPGIHQSYGIGADGSDPGQKLRWETVEGWLRDSRNYWLCTTRADGRPHAKPVWGVWIGGAAIFSTSARSISARNIVRDPEAVVHLDSGDDVAILEGRIERPQNQESLESFAEAYERKYDLRPDTDDPGAPVLALRPRVVLSWTEADFPNTATRWRF
jgi:general stress protein 26